MPTEALEGGGGTAPRQVAGHSHSPAALPPGELVVRSGQVRKISPLPGFNPQGVHPTASRYTDWAIPAAKECFVEDKPNVNTWKRKFNKTVISLEKIIGSSDE